MKIDGVEYKDVFEKTFPTTWEDNSSIVKCFTCQRIIENNEVCFTERTIYIKDKSDGRTPFYNICLDCIKTSKKAEKIIIPMLKIMYGGIIQIDRRNKKTNELKIFYY